MSAPIRQPSIVPGSELLLDSGQVAPDLFAAKLAVAELEDVEQAEAHLTALVFTEEWPSVPDVALPK